MNSEITSTFKNILIIDDMPENLRLLSDLLSKQGYKVRQVRNGATALRRVRQNRRI
jgi:CheY-like chemotaxis protein